MSAGAKQVPMQVFVLAEGATIYNIAPPSFTNYNQPDPSSGGVFTLDNYPCYGFLFVGVYDPFANSIGGGEISIATIPPGIPLEANNPGFADGIRLQNPGDWFRLRDINSQWFFGTKDTGGVGKKFILMAINDPCFYAGQME